jgi:hypothetical protein
MRSLIRQFDQHSDAKSWPILTGPIVVFTPTVFIYRKIMNNIFRKSAGNRDGPLIFHLRDGPPNVTGPPGGTGPPRYLTGSGPPKTTGPPMEWLVRKKSLKKLE